MYFDYVVLNHTYAYTVLIPYRMVDREVGSNLGKACQTVRRRDVLSSQQTPHDIYLPRCAYV